MRRRSAVPDTLTILQTSGEISGDDMDEILKFFPTAVSRLSITDPFLSVAIFCGVGLLASLLVLFFDQNLFTAWAYP
jgi:hypothetical protein